MPSSASEIAESSTLQSRLLPIIERVRAREQFLSPAASELKFRFDEAVFSSATAKCVDLNALINSGKIGSDNAFLFIANLRGLAEDLIVLQFLKQMAQDLRIKYLSILQRYNLENGLLAQVRFFRENNPFQPVAGGDPSKLESSRLSIRQELRDFWRSQGEIKKDGPTVRDMAERTDLVNTYDYIYFLSSNFVHFNPHTLIRMGWGPNEGPFEFSVHNFSGYYGDLASFYGAIILVGFYYRIGRELFSSASDKDITDILAVLDQVPRWPEIVTHEELNRRPPMLHFLAHAMRKATEGDTDAPSYGAILREVRGSSQ